MHVVSTGSTGSTGIIDDVIVGVIESIITTHCPRRYWQSFWCIVRCTLLTLVRWCISNTLLAPLLAPTIDG